MPSVRILVVTGASGTGKTTLVHEVEARGIAGASFHYFDSIGVPSAEQMVREFGSAASWQIAMTNRWLERLARCESRLCVLEGQVRDRTPGFEPRAMWENEHITRHSRQTRRAVFGSKIDVA
jgi:LPS sulfotransferase NodH